MHKRTNSAGKKPWVPPPARSSFKKIPALKAVDSYDSSTERLTAFRASSQSIFSTGITYAFKKFQDFHSDVELMRAHYYSLQSCIQFLKGPFRSCLTEEPPAKSLIAKATSSLNSFSDTVAELSLYLDTVEEDLKGRQWINALEKCHSSREEAVMKLLKAYKHTMVAFQFVLEVTNDARSQCNQEHLNKTVEDLKKQISELEKELATCKSEDQSAARIATKQFLHHINELRAQHSAEKEALRKAVLVQKELADEKEDITKELKDKLSEKEKLVCDIADERDQWKKNITAVNNKLTEASAVIENLQMQNGTLETKLLEFENFYDDQVTKMNSILQEKEESIKKLELEIVEVKKSEKMWQKKFENSEKELRFLKCSCEQRNQVLQLQKGNASKNSKEEVKALLSMLQEMKHQFEATDKVQNGTKTDSTEADSKVMTQNHASCAKLLEDVQRYMVTSTETFQQVFKKEFAASLEQQKSEFQKQLEKEIEERQKLQGKCEYLENMIANEHLSSSVIEDRQAFSKSYYRAFGIEAIRSREAFLSVGSDQEQIEKKVRELEKELQEKELELAAERKEKLQIKEGKEAEVQELQEKLSTANINYKCLHSYVKNLKRTYKDIYGTLP